MHVHLPKPLHGWRELFGEIGVIVIGVLIALAAEQAVEWLHWRQEAHETRAALNAEIASNAALYQSRLTHDRCFQARLGELDRMLVLWSDGQPLPRTTQPIVSEPTISAHTAVWQAAGGSAGAGALPLEDRLRYAVLYDEVANNERIRNEERELWRKLSGFDGEKRLDRQSIIVLRETLATLRRLHGVDKYNYEYFFTLLKPLGIKPQLIETVDDTPGNATFCRPLLT